MTDEIIDKIFAQIDAAMYDGYDRGYDAGYKDAVQHIRVRPPHRQRDNVPAQEAAPTIADKKEELLLKALLKELFIGERTTLAIKFDDCAYKIQRRHPYTDFAGTHGTMFFIYPEE